MVSIIKANTASLISEAKSLFEEYAKSLNFNLCFQNFDQELINLSTQYASPTGSLLVALKNEKAVGCVGIRRFEKRICEMKRLYVKPEYRNLKIGKQLIEAAVQEAKLLNYDTMRLDTLDSMHRANDLYKSFGFNQIEPYRPNPIEGAIYLELSLK